MKKKALKVLCDVVLKIAIISMSQCSMMAGHQPTLTLLLKNQINQIKEDRKYNCK